LDDSILILIPIFNDWRSAATLLRQLDEVLAEEGCSSAVLVVDDGSTSREGDLLSAGLPRGGVRTMRILRLRRNLGHQRAIAVGLCHALKHYRPDLLIVMDGDGEDLPTDVPRLIAAARRFEGNDHLPGLLSSQV
jgi:glycosyltransferase involved in cell wall biosynthesis